MCDAYRYSHLPLQVTPCESDHLAQSKAVNHPEVLDKPPAETPSQVEAAQTTSGEGPVSFIPGNANVTMPITTIPRNPQFWFLLCNTGPWFFTGIMLMFAGAVSIRFALLPRLYTCPSGATCPNHLFDPTSNVLNTVQTIVQYYLTVGCLLAGVGVSTVIAYQSWLNFQGKGNTIKNLDLNLSALKGGRLAALKFICKGGDGQLIGLFCLIQIAISLLIALAARYSISSIRTMGSVRVTFAYPESLALPIGPSGLFHSPLATLEGWFVDGGAPPFTDSFLGTFVVQDNRTAYASNAQPGGSRIMGSLSCSGAGISIGVFERNESSILSYNVSYGELWAISEADAFSESFFVRQAEHPDSISLLFLWAASNSWSLVNHTATSEGERYFAMCNHTVGVGPASHSAGTGVDDINPSQISISPAGRAASNHSACQVGDRDELCAAAITASYILDWWQSLRPARENELVSSQVECDGDPLIGGLLVTFHNEGRQDCPIDSKSWSMTLSTMLEAIVESSRKNGTATQDLRVHMESISQTSWWVQLFIPSSIILLYLACLGYTFFLSTDIQVLKELTLLEIMASFHSQDLQMSSELTESTNIRGISLATAFTTRAVKKLHDSVLRILPTELPVHFHRTCSPVRAHESPTMVKKIATLLWPKKVISIISSARSCTLLSLDLHTPSQWVAFGTCIMLAGTIGIRFVFLPRLYTCPSNAACPHHWFDPSSNVLGTLQTVMNYWLQCGSLIAGVGVVKIISYQSWFTFRRDGRTIQALGLNSGFLSGSIWDNTVFIWKEYGARLVGLFSLIQVVIGFILPFSVNRSISNPQIVDHVRISFAYPIYFGWLVGGGTYARAPSYRLSTWLVGGHYTPPDAFHGTFVWRDNRTRYASDARPGGPRIAGTVSCDSNNIFATADGVEMFAGLNVTLYNVTTEAGWAISRGEAPMEAFFMSFGPNSLEDASLRFLWAASGSSVIPNATTVNLGERSFAICNLTVALSPVSPIVMEENIVNPTRILVSPEQRNSSRYLACRSGSHDNMCGAAQVAQSTIVWWSSGFAVTRPGEMEGNPIYCNNPAGALAPYDGGEAQDCRLDNETWTKTISTMLDAIMHTMADWDAGNTTQSLWVGAESISRKWWWMQLVIPSSTMLLYVACVMYTFCLIPSGKGLKELTLLEIISASCTKDVRSLAQQAGLTDSTTIGGEGARVDHSADEN